MEKRELDISPWCILGVFFSLVRNQNRIEDLIFFPLLRYNADGIEYDHRNSHDCPLAQRVGEEATVCFLFYPNLS